MAMSNISEKDTLDFECGVKTNASIRISELPPNVRAAAAKLDVDCDGDLEIDDIAHAISDLIRKKKSNKNLRRVVAAFGVVALLLVACIFGATTTAARLSQDLVINRENGFAYVKGNGNSDILKTGEAVIFEEGASVGRMSDEQLINLREIILEEGSIRFQVRGHVRDSKTDDVILMVEGGTITFDEEGVYDARGDARYVLETVYGPIPTTHVHGTQRRQLYYFTCGASFIAGYSPYPSYTNPWANQWSF